MKIPSERWNVIKLKDRERATSTTAEAGGNRKRQQFAIRTRSLQCLFCVRLTCSVELP